jgi:putative nucleotidyltransferase with HDIG domain
MAAPEPRRDDRRWRPRPVLSFLLRLASVLVPAAAGVASAFGYARALPPPGGLARIPWLIGLLACSTVAVAIAERVAKRFLPLAMLLRLSLVFPDRAPSRFAMARGAGNVRVLERRIHEARDGGVDPAPVRAAEQILGLVAALSAHDRKTRGHSERVRAFTDLVATQLRLPDEDRDRLRWAALLHDIGKLRVPARILNKPGKPEPREWETLKGHPHAGAQIARPLMGWLGAWGDAIGQHHERFDGGGYPRGLAGSDISLAARIVSVADSFEVMTAARSYKKPMSVPAARRELAACAGGQFDPAIVRAFLKVSLGRLWWTVGPTSWAALVPVLGEAQRAGGQLAAAAKGATAAVVIGAAGVLPVVTGTAAASAPPSGTNPAVADRFGVSPGGDDGVRTGGIDRSSDAGGSTPGHGTHGTPAGMGSGSTGGDGSDGGSPVDPVDPIEDVVDDPAGGIGRTVRETTNTIGGVVGGAGGAVDDVVGGTGDVADGVVDGTTDAVDDLLGSDVGGLLDEPVDDVTDLLGGLLGR